MLEGSFLAYLSFGNQAQARKCPQATLELLGTHLAGGDDCSPLLALDGPGKGKAPRLGSGGEGLEFRVYGAGFRV